MDTYLAARERGDVDAGVRLFADNAVISDPYGGTRTGESVIRNMLQVARGRSARVVDLRTHGNQVSWVEPVGGGETNLQLRVDSVVQQGVITSIAYHRADQQLDPQAWLASQRSEAPQPPFPLGLGIALVLSASFGLALAFKARTKNRIRRRSPSALLADLRRWSSVRSGESN
jgi:hypothetical protein